MVPMDVPIPSLDMINRFILKQTFIDGFQPYPRMKWQDNLTLKDSSKVPSPTTVMLQYLLFLILFMGFIVSIAVVLTIIRTYWNRSSKYHRIRTINHEQGADFSINRSIEFTRVSSESNGFISPVSDDQPGTPLFKGFQSTGHGKPRYKVTIP